MKYYVDEEGNRYSVDYKTDEKTLIEAAKPKKSGKKDVGPISDPTQTADKED